MSVAMPSPRDSCGEDQELSGSRPVVAISSSLDEGLGLLRAPLDSNVSIEQVKAIVWRALDLDTSERNLRATIKPDSWVVVKPNIVTSPTNPKCMYWCDGVAHRGQNTDLRAVKALVDYILQHCQPRRVTIAEGGAEWLRVGEPDTPPDVAEDGWTVRWPEYGNLSYTDLVAGWQQAHPGMVDIVDLNYDERRFLPVPDPKGSGIGALQRLGATMRPRDRYGRESFVEGTGAPREGYDMPATVLDCDVLVSLAAMKTHLVTGTSLALKNYVGVTDPCRALGHPVFNRNSKTIAHQGDINAGFVDAFCYHPADYAVLEGFWGTEGNGPQWGDDVQHNVVIAGGDPVAVDALGSHLMGFNPEDLVYMRMAALKRLGETDLARIETVGAPLSSVQRRFRMGAGRSGISYAGLGVRDWLVCPTDGEGDWRQVTSDDRYVDLAYYLGPDAPSAVWAYAEVECDGPTSLEVWAGSAGPLAAYIGGERIVDLAPADDHRLGEARVRMSLPLGTSGLLLKVAKGSAGFGFSLLLCDEPGALPLGVHYRLPDQDRAQAAQHALSGDSR